MEVTSSELCSSEHDDDNGQQEAGIATNKFKLTSSQLVFLFKGLYCEDEGKEEEGAGDYMGIDRYLDDLSVEIDLDGVLMMTESDIPGASLNGKDPSEMLVVQLKRWLACRGAPTGGNKPELIER